MKSLLAIVLAVVMLLGAAAYAGTNDVLQPDVTFAMRLTQTIADLGDNPDVGNRSAGSAAERAAAQVIFDTMNEIGLKNVTMDEFTCDTWSFNRGRVYYTDESGAQQYLPLGGFATNLTADMQPVRIVYAGRGTADDYEGLDVEGKAVLIDINQADDWWIEIPTYEAHLRGALCVIVCNTEGYATYDEYTIGSQDICGPADAPAFSVSQNSAAILRELIERDGGETEIILDAESIVDFDGRSQNVWGEIPGRTDEVIYFIAHYDGYYHFYFDDACGVGSILAIAKAMAESGIQPDKTIRFGAHGAEEWGKSDTEYDWATGAFKQITQVRPEWAENAFAVLNIDGMYPVAGHTDFSVAASWELADFAEEIALPLYEGSAYGIEVNAPATCWTEDFSYGMAGVPAIVASHAEPEEIYHGPAYHSSMDNVTLGVDEDAWQLTLNLFSRYALELDALACRPMNFAARFEAIAELNDEADVSAALEAARAADERIAALNADYAATGDAALREEGLALDRALQSVYRRIMEATTAFDWEDNVVFPFEVAQANTEALHAAIDCLKNGDAATALDEYLWSVDYNWYAYDFSQETYEYMLDKMYVKSEGTWGEGMLRDPGENLWTLIQGLFEKAEQEGADFSDEIAALEAALTRQQENLARLNDQLGSDLNDIAAQLSAAIA